MKRHYLILPVILILAALVIAACSTEKQTDLKNNEDFVLQEAVDKVVVYYQLRDGKALVPVTEEIDPTQEAPQKAVEKLLQPAENQFLQNVFPANTKLKDLYLKKDERTVYLVLSNELRNISASGQAKQAIDSLVLTLTEFDNIDNVQILIDGKEPQNLDETDLNKSLQRPELINPIAEDIKNPVHVFFSDSQGMFTVPATVDADSAEIDDKISKALHYLIAGPGQNKYHLSGTIWKGTKLNGFSYDEAAKIVTVDLSGDAVAYGGGHTAESMFIESLVQTMTGIAGIDKVQLLLDGKSIDTLPEGTPVKEPLSEKDLN